MRNIEDVMADAFKRFCDRIHRDVLRIRAPVAHQTLFPQQSELFGPSTTL